MKKTGTTLLQLKMKKAELRCRLQSVIRLTDREYGELIHEYRAILERLNNAEGQLLVKELT